MAKNTPRVQICTPGANLHLGANCAHERGCNISSFAVIYDQLFIMSIYKEIKRKNMIAIVYIKSALSFRILSFPWHGTFTLGIIVVCVNIGVYFR